MQDCSIGEARQAGDALLLKQLYERDIEHVSAETSPHDDMFQGHREHYASVGQSALRCIRLAMLAAGKGEFHSILDFGCGFGRVLRILRAAFPDAELAACDISRDAIDFCAKTFHAAPIPSHEDPAQIKIRKQFDLIWCGTLLTNVNAAHFVGFLKLFHSLMPTGGVFVFTTHGPFVAQRLRTDACNYGLNETAARALVRDYGETGFGYRDYPQETLSRLGLKSYGVSVTRPSWVCRQIESLGDLRILTYTERAWDNHQDSVACMRE
jgi:SAM-dependent methyltransferase